MIVKYFVNRAALAYVGITPNNGSTCHGLSTVLVVVVVDLVQFSMLRKSTPRFYLEEKQNKVAWYSMPTL